MAGVAFWSSGPGISGALFSNNPWDVVWLAGRPLPGRCEVRGTGIVQIKIDEKKAPGRDGAALTATGYAPGPFEVICEVWTEEQWNELQNVIDRVWRRPEKKSKLSDIAVTIHHPALDAIHVSAAAIKGVSPPEKGSVEGSKIVKFSMIESQLPGKKKQVKTAVSAVGVVPQFRNDAQPKNATPVKPSTVKEARSPKGQPAEPGGGSD